MEIKVDDTVNSPNDMTMKALSMINTPPEEALQNIDRSRFFEMSPDSYKEVKSQLDPEAIAIERMPAQITPEVEQYVRQSEQHAALAKEDLGTMDVIAKRLKYYKNQVLEIPSIQREINELANKKITDGVLTQGEEEQLASLNATIREMSQDDQSLGVGAGEQLAVQVVSATGDFIRSYTENLGLLAAGVGGGAAVGAVAGSLVPGLGTAAGASAGAIKGWVGASTVIGFVDGYTQMRGSVYNELSQAVDSNGEPLRLPHDRMAKVSQAVGIISGVAGGIAGKVLSSSNPFLKRFASPKLASKLITGNAAMLARMELLGGVAESILAEGGTEALTEFTKMIGVNFAQMDESEASLINAIDQSITPDNLKQLGQSALVGGLTGGVISAGMSSAGYAGMKSRYEEVQTLARKREEVLTSQNMILETAKDIKNTKMNQIAPHEMNSFLKGLTSLAGIDENVYFDMTDLRTFADTPEKGEAIRKIYGDNNEMVKLAQQLDSPIEMSKADLLGIVTEFPELTDYMKLTPDGENPLQARNKAKDFVTRLGEAEQARNDLMRDLNVDEPLTPELQQQLADINKIVEAEGGFDTEADYLANSQTFAESAIVSKEEAAALNKTHAEARKAAADSLVATANEQFDTINNRIFRDVDAKDIQADITALDRELKVLDRFTEKNLTSEAAMAKTSQHKKKGYSPVAIDPRSMPEDLRAVYLDNETLKKRKVFVEGGIDINESAALNGVETGAELLKILSETPSRKQIKEGRKQRQVELKERVNETTLSARHNKINKAFTDLTKVHLKEMEYMRTKEWPTAKRGIIKIASPLPTVEALNIQAKQTVNKMKIRDLNPTKFKVGETKMQREALKNYLAGSFEQAFANKEKAALNNEMRKEATLASEKTAQYLKFWEKVDTPKYRQELKDAGYSDAFNDLMSIYKLDGSLRNETEQSSFNDFVRKQVELGEWMPTIPDRLDNTQQSYKDMTFEQYEAITKTAQHMVNLAKKKNKLSALAEQRAEIRTVERVAVQIDELAKAHFDYDPRKSESKDADYMSVTEVFHSGVQTALTSLSSMKSIINQLDEHKVGGFFYETFGRNVKEARTNKRAELLNVENRSKEIINQFYGMDNFKKMFNEFVEIPEFKNVATLGDGDGRIRKVDLLTLQAYMGDPDGKQAMSNFITRDGRRLNAAEIQTVLNRVLNDNDLAFMQNFMLDHFKQFEQRSLDLHKRTTGDDVEMIKGEPIVHNNKVYPGGYFPIKRQMLPDEVRLAKSMNKKEQLFKKVKDVGARLTDLTPKENNFFAEMRSAEMTQQGRYKERTGSQRPLDIKFENMFDFTEEIIHDLNFREVGTDNLKLLKDPEISKSIKNVVGEKKYVSLLNHMKDTISKTTERESTLFGEEYKFLNGIIQQAHTLHAVKTLGLNLTSAAIQPASLANVTLKNGPKTAVYMSKTAAKLAANLTHFNDFSLLAEQINPDIRFEKDGVDNSIVKQSYEFIPKGRRFFKGYDNASSSGMIRFRDFQQQAINGSFFAMREADRMTKIVTTLATSEQFLNGDIDGYPLSRVEKMSEAEKAKTMRTIVQQTIDSTLTASAPEDRTSFEKLPGANLFARYWVDARNGLNTMLAQTDRIRGNIRRGENMKAATNTALLALTAGVMQAYMNTVRDNEESIIRQLQGVKDGEDFAEFVGGQAYDFITAPVDVAASALPGINAIKYQTELDVRGPYRNVSVPLFGVASDIAAGVVITKDILREVTRSASKLESPRLMLSEPEQKIMLTNLGYIAGGAPTNKMYNALETLQSKPVKNTGKDLIQDIQELHKEIKAFIKMFSDDEDAKVFIEDLKEYQKTLPQFDNDVSQIVPPNTMEVMRQGEWTKVDPDTGAAGIYQFTEERWNEIMALNPDLGLTENGRVAKNPEQQEKAMKWVIEDNTRGLMAYEIPVTEANLLGAHKFGFDNFAAIMDAQDSEKLSEVLGDDFNNPVFKNFKTVKSVKDYLRTQVDKNI